jgi:hypothetical protein
VIRRTSIAGLLVAGALALGGCVTEVVTRSPLPPGPVRPAPRATDGISAAILPLGSVPYDNRSLPLVSPDGEFVATQTGRPPEWPTLLAGIHAPLPDHTRVEVYRLQRELGQADYSRTTPDGMLLGRGGNDEGFLVEAPQADGARWIGFVRWVTSGAEWLVADENVNAFASVGAAGRLAWSRRAPDGEHFDLVIRNGGAEWLLGAQGGDWLLPVWSDTPDALFALRLEAGRLEAVFMNAATPSQTRSTLVRLPIATNRTRHDAYQCLASFACMQDLPPRTEPYLLFWHPTAGRIGLWRPVTAPDSALMLLANSIAAAIDDSGTAVVGTADQLYAESLNDLAACRALVPGAHVPRRVADPDWPFVLLSPRDERTGLIAFRLIGGAD